MKDPFGHEHGPEVKGLIRTGDLLVINTFQGGMRKIL